ncbi:MAG: hypothetical protein R3B57_00460 [Phycisphaerales bacterium]
MSPLPSDTPPRALEQARRVLRCHREGVLLSDDVAHPCRFIIDPATGELILRVGRDVLLAHEVVLHVPEEETPAAGVASVQLLLDLHETDADADPACDRHTAAHPGDDAPAFARAAIVSGRLAGEVFEGRDVMAPNQLARGERAMLARLNEDRAALRRAALRLSGLDIPDPLAVAADRFGFDVRAAFGVVRAEFDRPARDADDALAILERLLS